MHKILQSMICLTIAFVLFFASFACAESLSSVDVEAAPLSSDQPTLDGMVRVYLSSLGSPASLTLTVSGSYSLSTGTSLSSGDFLYVTFSSSTGAITLTRNGVSYNMGSTFTVRRHSTTGSNGIKISQARKPDNLYPGDIQLKAVSLSGGGYKLYTIAHIYIEDYLYGVVPYEMGSSAPMEALKAQAVAARTYTVRMMNARSSWSYDVVDTTGDQTYNGTPTAVTNCNTAVDSTKGILLKSGSSYTATYYSSSNGGQTESIKNAWGTSGYDYLGVKDDPFDYANPSSVVKQTTVYGDAGSSSNNASLISLLKSKVVSALAGAGYNATYSNTTLQTINSVTAHTPMYASPSRLYTKMNFSLSVTTYNASNVFVTVTTTVTCDIFSELESLLGMSIQSGSNELWSVVTSGTTFKLQARRYGHGLGMSQRGAMYMGQLGFTYDEILGFYYPGSTRVGCTFTNTILSANSTEEIITSENPVDLDDDSTDTGVRGIVTLQNDTQLAVRSAKSATASVLTVLSNGTPVTVLADDGTWCLIAFGSITGYVPASALSILGTAPESDDSAISTVDGFAVVKANGYLNLRESGSYSASILSTAPSGAILTVLSLGDSWAHIQYGTIAAYACTDYLTFYTEYPEEIQEPDTGDTDEDTTDTETLSAVVATDSGSLNMRQFPQAGSTILTTIPRGAVVSVTSQGETWSGVSYQGYDGYVMTTFLSFDDGTNDTEPDETVETTAIVYTESGSLNLRKLPKSGSAIYCTIPRLTVIQVHSKGSEWCQVTYSGITGYVMTAFLSFTETDDADATDETDGGSDTSGDAAETAVVTTESGSLNLRTEAVMGSSVLTRIPKGETIEVLQKLAEWTYTCYQDYYGYVMNAFLTFAEDSADEIVDSNPVAATVTTASGSLNLRDAPYGGVLTQIPQNTIVDVFSHGAVWCYLNYDGVFGYAMTQYLTFDTENETDNSQDDQDDDSTDGGDISGQETASQATSATVTVGTGSLNLRVSKSETAGILTTIPNGTVVALSVQGSEWCKVVYGAFQGYVQTRYLSIGASDETDETDDTGDTGDAEEPADESVSVTAWVNTASGSLNLRETASLSAAVLAQIPQYAQVEVLSDITAVWCQTSYGIYIGYVMSEYLTTTQPSGDTESSDTGDTSTQEEPPMDSTLHEQSRQIFVYVRPSGDSTTIPLYDACSEDSDLLYNMMENSQVEIIRAGDTWCEVLYFDQQGYCLRDGLSFFEE